MRSETLLLDESRNSDKWWVLIPTFPESIVLIHEVSDRTSSGGRRYLPEGSLLGPALLDFDEAIAT